MKDTLRYFIILAALLIPFTISSVREKFPIMVGITLGVTFAYWGMVLFFRKKNKAE
ncbi:MAG: hypothetical protein SPL42_05895 [Bacteroidales bacterium]|nr:hypothetical protein [Bacteroidales bacterium]MDY6347945.1 hypothetical protein [Bacteroidales bacterium]